MPKLKKKAALDSFAARGATLLYGDLSDEESKLLPLLRDIDVVVSSVGPNQLGDPEMKLLAMSKKAGVKWFIPSGFGFDLEQIGLGSVVPLFDAKIKILDAVKSSGMIWTEVTPGTFMEWMLGTAFFGVNVATRTLTIPFSGKTAVSLTSLVDIGMLLADAIVTGRGRNANIHFAGSTVTYDQLAEILQSVGGGAAWKKVIRSESELKNAIAADPKDFVARFAYLMASVPRASSWPVSESYNGKFGIATISIQQIAKAVVAPNPT